MDKKARKEIAERLGHSRTDITSNYIGNYQTMQKTQKKKLGWLIRALEGNTDPRELAQSFEIEGVLLQHLAINHTAEACHCLQMPCSAANNTSASIRISFPIYKAGRRPA
ncbi:MAG: hypothetical protein PHQ73_13685 [Gallionella sp.]|nr:hypothetical protein [Gallionella sp.]